MCVIETEGQSEETEQQREKERQRKRREMFVLIFIFSFRKKGVLNFDTFSTKQAKYVSLSVRMKRDVFCLRLRQ